MKHRPFLLTVLFIAAVACSRGEKSVVTPAAAASPLPVLSIDTAGRAIADDMKVPGTVRVIERHDGSLRDITRRPVVLQSDVGVELHGETTQDLPKPSYDFEFVDEQGDDRELPLLGLPAGSDWTLKGCGRDETCLRDALVFAVTRDLGRYAPRTRFTELFINGQYRGIYVLIEKVRRGKTRVDLAKPARDRAAGDISGGYIFQLDLAEGTPDDAVARDWVSPASGLVYSYYYPRYDEVTPAQRAYLRDYVAQFETMMEGRDWNHPQRGYRSWIDVPSWIDFALVQELSNNVDGYFKSVYLQKRPASAGNRLTLGPVWDFDAAFGVADFRDGRSTEVWTHTMNRFGMLPVPYDPPRQVPPVPAYWERLWSDAAFAGDLKCRWQELRSGALSMARLRDRIDTWVGELAQAHPRDNARWHDGDLDGYRGEIAYLKSWLGDRAAWMDAHLPGTCITG
jgi:hypothetical protein